MLRKESGSAVSLGAPTTTTTSPASTSPSARPGAGAGGSPVVQQQQLQQRDALSERLRAVEDIASNARHGEVDAAPAGVCDRLSTQRSANQSMSAFSGCRLSGSGSSHPGTSELFSLLSEAFKSKAKHFPLPGSVSHKKGPWFMAWEASPTGPDGPKFVRTDFVSRGRFLSGQDLAEALKRVKFAFSWP
ncbi:hypothetical protein B0H12DRAFT_376848 [Mycena haematopus]|nr:hypothetical protein B0H12DRAFT_376848 [Mycena haematopus]